MMTDVDKDQKRSTKICIHSHSVLECWCWARFGNFGLVNGQLVEFSGDKVLKFLKRPPRGGHNPEGTSRRPMGEAAKLRRSSDRKHSL